MKQLDKIYNPKSFEDNIYKNWMEKGYFHAEVNKDKKPYTIMMPPPNITGQLHMGHALDATCQDVLIRFKRMQGYEALWLPGTDHASIATEAKIVEAMAADGITKDDIGRDGFLERAWEWNKLYGGRIVEQQKKMGGSCDWERSRFTMDETCSKAVQEVFLSLYEKGLIYRGERIINWCPHCKTSISDAEVEHEEHAGHFWHIKYPLTDGSGYLEVATTRPETMLGDTAVAVNPDDERYKHLIGKTLMLPLMDREIPIIADNYVEMDFGTGCVKMTPAHDPNDFEVGVRHNLPIINVMNDDASINENGGKYCGMERYEARKAVVKDLESLNLLIKVEDHTHNVGSCYRCSTVVEPWISKQWFVKMEPLAKPAIKSVREGDIKFIPERFDKIYFHWMENIKDWCISRQLWWGHRIPAYYCGDCSEVIVSAIKPEKCKCGSANLMQDEDTLDTWFSSALWTFSTLGWPKDTEEFNYFHPTDVLVTGWDIIFFWVARMIFSALEHTGEIPFHTVYIHGIVRDAQGRKMSKSLGNGIDPLEVIENYGADALRLTLATGNTPGNDMRFSDEKVVASRNFANKLWNAARFILMNLPEDREIPCELPKTLTTEDKWVVSKYNTLIKEVCENIDKYELGLAVQKLYDFIWDIYCDWYIELAKIRLSGDDEAAADNARMVLVYVLGNTLKLLHPFMPFITEEIWQALPHEGESIMISDMPQYDEKLSFSKEEKEFGLVMSAIKAVRNVRAEMNVPPSKKAELLIETAEKEVFASAISFLQKLAYADKVTVGDKFDSEGAVQVVSDGAKILLPMSQLIDKEKELARLSGEKAACDKDITFLSGKLSNEGFVAKAPAKVVEIEKEKLKKAEEKLAKILESIAALS